MKSLYITLAVFLCVCTSLSAFQSIESVGEFDRALRSKDLVLCYLYKKSPELLKKQPRLEEIHKNLNTILKEADGERYTPEFSEVYFIKVNVSRPHLREIERRYKLKRNNEILLFQDGDRVATLRNVRADKISTTTLRKFIDKHLGEEIDEKIERKEEQERQREQERRRRAEERREWYARYGYPYYYGGWGYPYHWGYPYWGAYPYHHGPHFGIGFSFH